MTMSFAPQLAFNGNCREAFETYAALFDGKISVMNTFGANQSHALPPGSAPAANERIRFAELRFGDHILRGNDVPADAFRSMRGFSLSAHLHSGDEARRIFSALSERGAVTTPLTKVDWADLFGMVIDRFGVSWIILALSANADRLTDT